MMMAKGKRIAAVAFLFVLYLPSLLLAADGDLDTSFHPPDGSIQTDGKIIVSGGIKGVADTDAVVLRYTSAGNPDTDFGTNGAVTYNGEVGMIVVVCWLFRQRTGSLLQVIPRTERPLMC
jgi:hypothetical protein